MESETFDLIVIGGGRASNLAMAAAYGVLYLRDWLLQGE